jgi:hypothetical protein
VRAELRAEAAASASRGPLNPRQPRVKSTEAGPCRTFRQARGWPRNPQNPVAVPQPAVRGAAEALGYRPYWHRCKMPVGTPPCELWSGVPIFDLRDGTADKGEHSRYSDEMERTDS